MLLCCFHLLAEMPLTSIYALRLEFQGKEQKNAGGKGEISKLLQQRHCLWDDGGAHIYLSLNHCT